MAEEQNFSEEEEPVIVSLPEITPLASIAIEIHELFLELHNAGFTKSEALTLAGMVLSNTATVERGNGIYLEDEDEDDELGNWDTIFKEYDEQNPEGDEKI